MLQGTPQPGVLMDEQGGLVLHPPAGFIEVRKVGSGVAAMAVQEGAQPTRVVVLGCAVCVRGVRCFHDSVHLPVGTVGHSRRVLV